VIVLNIEYWVLNILPFLTGDESIYSKS